MTSSSPMRNDHRIEVQRNAPPAPAERPPSPERVNIQKQKGFWSKYLVDVQSKEDWGNIPVLSRLGAIVGSTVSTAWNAVTLRPIEGAFTEAGFPTVGKIARWATVAAVGFGIWKYLNLAASLAEEAAGKYALETANKARQAVPVLAGEVSEGLRSTANLSAGPGINPLGGTTFSAGLPIDPASLPDLTR